MWMTAVELSRLLHVPIGTIYRWAHEDCWRRTDRKHRPVYYDVRAAQRSLATRRSGDLLAS